MASGITLQNANGGTLNIEYQGTAAGTKTVVIPEVDGEVATLAGVRAEIPNMLNASGSAPMYACRAWVNFNGTGTVAIRGSGNVSSITDNGVGDYTVNFTTAMPDANYATAGSCRDAPPNDTGGVVVTGRDDWVPTTGSRRINTTYNGGSYDVTEISVVFLR